jgi:DNA mismatch repair ATPase MutS
MLEELTIKNFAIIESEHIEFEKGFTVLSGETGAGKSILIGALSFLLGGKADVSQIRSGSTEASVSGSFWLQKNYLREAFLSIGKIESLISISTISLVKEDSCLPVVSNKFEFKNIRHPLICESKCIPNSFEFSKRNIITGSNMSGKTTFMRSIGTNYILFLSGSNVCANSFEAPILKLFTSMKVVDDVNNNISTFYGEILRVKNIVEYIKDNKPMLVLVDEIFKGTNTHDRIIGAKSFIEKLNRDNIYSIITTHDPELCKVEDVKNYHFEEHYEDDKILFDYLIHDGIANTRNAIYLLKLAGIVDKEK